MKELLEAIEYITKHGKRVLTPEETPHNDFLPYEEQPIDVKASVRMVESLLRLSRHEVLRQLKRMTVKVA